MTSDIKGTVLIASRRCSALSQKAKALITVPETWGPAATFFPWLSAQRLAQQVQPEANWAPAVPAGFPWFYLSAQKCPVPLWTLIKAAQAELSAWLSSSSTIPSAHAELLSLLCRGHSCITDLLRKFLWDKGTKHGLCITPRSITKPVTSITSEDWKKMQTSCSYKSYNLLPLHIFFKGK